MLAAGVPERLEYTYVYALSNPTSLTTSNVSSKSSSVSPGNPTIISCMDVITSVVTVLYHM